MPPAMEDTALLAHIYHLLGEEVKTEMRKFGKNLTAMVLAAAVMVSTAVTAFAVGSPVEGNIGKNTTGKTETVSDTGVKVTGATSTDKAIYIDSVVHGENGDFDVDVIGTGTVTAKKNKVTIAVKDTTTFEKQVLKGKGLKTKKVVLRIGSTRSGKLKAANFNKKAFKGYKGKIVVRKGSISKKEFKKLVKKLKKGGFKGKIVRK